MFESFGHYVCNLEGSVNLDTDASFGGSYKGVDGMGLFWSMRPNPRARTGTRFLVRDVATPIKFKVQVHQGHVMLSENLIQEPLAVKTILRTYLADDATRVEISEGRLRGTLFLPKGKGRFPGVIDMFGSHGGLLEHRAALLASHGFVVLALAFFGYKDLPEIFLGLELEYFMEAVDWLSKHDRVYQYGIGFIGVSYGSQIVLQTAAQCSNVSAVVAISGDNVISNHVIFRGKTLGVPGHYNLFGRYVQFTEEGIATAPGFYSYLRSMKNYEIPVENIRGRILFITGDSDQCTNATENGRLMQERLAHWKRPPLQHLHFPRTGHLIELPYMPMCSSSFQKIFRKVFAYGGSVIEHSAAQEQSWKAILDFLKNNIKETSSML